MKHIQRRAFGYNPEDSIKPLGLVLITVGVVFGGLVIWAFVNRIEATDSVVLGVLVAVCFMALGIQMLTDPTRRL